MKYLSASFILICILLVTSPVLNAATPEQEYAAIRAEYVALLGSPQSQRQRQNWIKVIEALDNYSRSPRAGEKKDDAEFLHARAWHGLARASANADDAIQALSAYEALVRNSPKSNLADDALIYAAELAIETFFDQSRAYNYYLQITTELPPGDMLGEAQSRLKRLSTSFTAKAQTRPVLARPPATEDGLLNNIRVWSSPEYTRVVLDLSSRAAYEPHQLKGADPRIYVDLAGLKLGSNVLEKQQVSDGVVAQIRSSNLDQTTVRVVLDLNTEADYQVFSLENPNRIIIDVRRPSAVESSPVEISALPPTAGPDSIAGILDDVPTSVPPVLRVPQHNKSTGINLIVVDAGHGGKDPGAVGINETFEKDVTLQLAKKLAEALRKELNCKVLLTRNDDRYMTLQSRTAYANKVGADLFISLHANASPNPNAYGLETYYLNLTKNNQAAEVAARENGTTLEEVSNLEAILFDLMANAKINESSRLAAEIQRAMVQHLTPQFSSIKDLGVRQGPFHVLLGATMPSVLVEAAFISNSREEKRLKSDNYQARVAQAIVLGVKDYSATLDQVARQ